MLLFSSFIDDLLMVNGIKKMIDRVFKIFLIYYDSNTRFDI